MPNEAIAWIVAVEKYSGPELCIKQPVGSWALEFAELMLDNGASNVVLSTSLNDVPSYLPKLEKLRARNVVCTGATQADIQNTLEKIRGTGTLFLYWVGHGIMAPSRQMLCADSQKMSALRVVSADSLLKRLRAPEYPRLQIGFFECCAQVVMNPPAVLDLGGDGRTITRQFFYHAASAGETATGSTQTPGFSSTVLQAIRALKPFPPDPVTFFDGLKASLGKIPMQTRPFLQRTEESGDVWSTGDPNSSNEISEAAGVAGLVLTQFDRLWQPVRTAGVTPVEVANAYANGTLPAFIENLRTLRPMIAAPYLLDKAARQLDLEREFEPFCLKLRLLFQEWLALYDRLIADYPIGMPERLEDLPRLLLSALDKAQEETGLRLFIKLLLMAAKRGEKREMQHSIKLRKALASHPRLEPLYLSVVDEMPVEDDQLYLLLALDWEPNSQTASLIKAWISPGANSPFDQRKLPTRSKLAEQINAVVQKVLEEFPEKPLTIELLTPNDLLCAPRELLELVNTDLGTRTWLEDQHPITLRWHDRMRGDDRYRPGSWKQLGQVIRATAEGAESLSCGWRPPVAGVDGSCHVVGLSFAGPCPSDPRRNRPQFFEELLKGSPYMCWPRNAQEDIESFKSAVVDLLNRSRLNSLPTALRDGRSDELLKDLVILIDEPHRNPYSDLDYLTETVQRGTS
jgi:hypothetical protein